jgi:hypothetical protein
VWRRLLNRLIPAWRQACGDTPEPSAIIIDRPLSLSASGQLWGERSCRSAPTCFGRGFDGGKRIKGSIVEAPRSMILFAVDTRRAAKLITVSRWRSMSRRPTGMGPGNAVRRYSKGAVPVLHQLAGFKGTALGDLSYRGQRLAGEALGITLQPSAGGHGGTFIPEGQTPLDFGVPGPAPQDCPD